MAVNLALEVNQGASLRRRFRLLDQSGQSLDLTGAFARLQIRRTLRSADVLIEANSSNGKLVIDGAEGTITLTLSASETAALNTSCTLGLEVTFADGDRRNYPGFLRVNPTVVR
jgi:hypothetical protein